VKRYGSLRALDGLDLDVDAGEFFGLLGPNGAGKTTFINILVGLADATAGEALVFGHDVTADYRAARDAIGLAPQEFNVDRFFPIREVLQHKAGYHGVPWEEAGQRADEALETVGIYEMLMSERRTFRHRGRGERMRPRWSLAIVLSMSAA